MDSIKKKILSTPLSPPPSTNGTNSVSMQKSNHVSTVLLYGIPIVSLYIEGQERLCLAQISNTLLKQFSYNEIHNRRVALGITCVQCTPVQLEILRRAGAMPVSSRRCGMITRREAERLCKSFLGDNTPPRLPDDFAFSVQHRCAWGCRGAFLPSRYNSSRAKCIKCNYCGLFFSPNKFIFHSHRISASDKYVQPDAANFNSWRRHMTLCGQPQEEVTHAWEDVKAMFNGGTRKRLVNSNVCGSRLSLASPSGGGGGSGGGGASTTPVPQAHSPEIKMSSSSSSLSNIDDSTMPPKRALRDEQYNYGTVTTAAAVVGVTAVSATVGAMHPAALPPMPALGSERELALMPFSRNLVMDYMWNQQQHQLQQHQQQQQQQHQPNIKKLHEHAFGFGNCTLPWLKSEVAGAGLVIHAAAANQQLESCLDSKSSPIVARRNIFSITKSTKTHSQELPKNECAILNSASAFKPVQQTQLNAVAAVASAALLSTSVFSGGKPKTVGRCTHGLEFDTRMAATTYLTSQSQTAGESLRSAEQELIIHSKGLADLYKTPTKLTQRYAQSDDDDVAAADRRKLAFQAPANVQQQSNSSDEDETHVVDDDDIMVDIETTEDDTPPNAYQTAGGHSPSCTFAASNTSGSTCNSPSNIDVDSVTTEADGQYSPSLYNNICSENSTTSSTQANNPQFGLKQCLDLTSANAASRHSKNAENAVTRMPTTTADIEDDDGPVATKYKETNETHESRLDAYRSAPQADVQQTLAPKAKSSKLSERSTSTEELNEDNNNDTTNNNSNALKATLHLQPQPQTQQQQQPLNYHQATLNYKPLNVFQHEWSYPIGSLRHYFIQETSTRTNGVG